MQLSSRAAASHLKLTVMFTRKTYPLFAASSLLLAVLTVSFFMRDSVFGQNDAPASAVGATLAGDDENDAAVNSNFKKAADLNAQLKNDLKWTFGGKAQTGWRLYVPLIQHLIKTEAAPESEKFAAALAVWQRKSGLEATGVLETETLARMVRYWQSRRLNSSIYPASNEIFSAPIMDFYDPTRSPELLKVRHDAYAAYKQMVAAARADKSLNLKSETKFLKIISAFRSREYQEQLRRQSPNSGRAGLAVNSPHFTGSALDIYVGGEPVSTRDDNRAAQIETPVYKWLVKNAERFGFVPYYYEPWHWEYAPQNVKTEDSASR
jgi:zinc D-Ala-D-Ala carboxypeptidase